jgi:hypothetical protein
MSKPLDYKFFSSASPDEALRALRALSENPRLAIFYAVQDDWVMTETGQPVPDDLWKRIRFDLLMVEVADGAFIQEQSEFLDDNGITRKEYWHAEEAEEEE